jgi:hypothetical protein
MPPKSDTNKPKPKPNTTKDTKSGGGTKVVNLDDEWLYHSKK